MRLVHVSNGPLPYHTPILNELNELVDLHVIYMSATHPLGSFVDLWGTEPHYAYETYWSLPITWRGVDFRAQVSVGVSRRLRQLAPDTVLVISWGPLAWEPLVWCRRSRARAVMWAESTAVSGLLRGRASNSFRRAVVSLSDTVVTESSSATTFVRHLGGKKVVTSCLPSPNAPAIIEARRRDEGSISYLFVGRLIERKRPLEAVCAFLDIMDELPRATLTVVGDGPLRCRVADVASRGAGRISVLPRLEGERLSGVYAASDVLIVPSQREGWGLVVNEALAHGLYVVAADEVASALDLLKPGCGRIVPTHDGGALLRAALRDAGTVVKHGLTDRVARARCVERCTAARFAADIERAATWAWSEP